MTFIESQSYERRRKSRTDKNEKTCSRTQWMNSIHLVTSWLTGISNLKNPMSRELPSIKSFQYPPKATRSPMSINLFFISNSPFFPIYLRSAKTRFTAKRPMKNRPISTQSYWRLLVKFKMLLPAFFRSSISEKQVFLFFLPHPPALYENNFT